MMSGPANAIATMSTRLEATAGITRDEEPADAERGEGEQRARAPGRRPGWPTGARAA